MKKSKINLVIGFTSLSLMALAGCGGSDSSESSTSSQSSTSTSSTWTKDTRPQRVELTLAKNSIVMGSTLFDGAKPTVIYIDDAKGTRDDITTWSNTVEYKVINVADETKVYDAGTALPVGEYYVTARHKGKNRTDRASLTVTASHPEEASEGHGYHTVTRADMADARVSKHEALGALGAGKTPSLGNPKLLIIPVQFKNVKFSDNGETEAKVQEVLNQVFFADTKDAGGWESLRSYYLQSSYGQLEISGEVTPIFTYDKDTTAVTDGEPASIVNAAAQWAATQGYDINSYDIDGDTYIDGIEVVYITDRPTPSQSGSDSSLWWNFTSCITSNYGRGTKAKPVPYRYFWSRWDYVRNNYYGASVVDAHTIVHETGHMLGLNDYYSYDHNEGPAGCVDMMDMNVGDHNAYSKMCYNWVDAKVVDGTSKDFEITLNSYTDTGDFLVVRNTTEDAWNETPWDEYLIIEYYTPTGVNAVDSKGYGEWTQSTSYGHGGTYEFPGVQVFHVDARLSGTWGTWTESGGTKRTTQTGTGYVDDIVDTIKYNTDHTYVGPSGFPHDNTPSRSINPETGGSTPNRELSAIFSSGLNGLSGSSYTTYFGKMGNLFGISSFKSEKDTSTEEHTGYYSSDTYSNFKMRDFFPNDLTFNDGTVNNWTFSVTAQTEDSVTLHFISNE